MKDTKLKNYDGEEDPRLVRYRGGLEDPDSDAVTSEYTRPCKVVVKGYYNDWSPYSYAQDGRGNVLMFACAVDAQAWIAEQQAQGYVLAQDEYDWPMYTIVAA